MKSIFRILVFLVLAACVSDPDSGTDVLPPAGQVVVPDGFDWKMIKDDAFSFRVLDVQPATVRIFSSQEGDLIAFGPASAGNPFVTTLSLPYAQTSLFVQKIAADGSVVERSISVSQAKNYLFPQSTPLQFVANQNKAVRELPDFDLVVSSGSTANLYAWIDGANRPYPDVLLTGTFNGSVNFIWTTVNNASTVYIDGNVGITGMSNQEKPNNKIIVLDGATLTISMNTFSGIDIEVDEGGTVLFTGGYNSNRTLLNNGSVVFNGNVIVNDFSGISGQMINNGSLLAKALFEVTREGSYFENNGSAVFESEYKQNVSSVGTNNAEMSVLDDLVVINGATLNNTGAITAASVVISASPLINNSCSIVTGLFQTGNQTCVLNNAPGALVSAETLYTTGGFTLNLSRGSVFQSVDIDVYNLQLTAPSVGSGIALFKYEHAESVHTSTFSGPVEVVCAAFETEAAAYYNVTFSAGADLVAVQTQSVPQTECNGGAGLIGGDPGTGDEPNSFIPSQDGFNTVAFEDMWPKEGDYDLNDLVMAFNIGFFESDNQVTRMIIQGKVMAIGASAPNHALGLQLDLVARSRVASVTRTIPLSGSVFSVDGSSGVESGSELPVIPIFSSARDMITITSNGNSFINTDPVAGTDATPMEWSIDVVFSEPIPKANLTLNQGLNFFLLLQGNRDKEVHLFGYEPTSLANNSYFGTQDDNSIEGARYSTIHGYPWALIVPGTFRYPKEKIAINQAYTFYDDWISTNKLTHPDWYEVTSGNVVESMLFPVEP